MRAVNDGSEQLLSPRDDPRSAEELVSVSQQFNQGESGLTEPLSAVALGTAPCDGIDDQISGGAVWSDGWWARVSNTEVSINGEDYIRLRMAAVYTHEKGSCGGRSTIPMITSLDGRSGSQASREAANAARSIMKTLRVQSD